MGYNLPFLPPSADGKRIQRNTRKISQHLKCNMFACLKNTRERFDMFYPVYGDTSQLITEQLEIHFQGGMAGREVLIGNGSSSLPSKQVNTSCKSCS
jgi:hypothetical protein